MRTKPNPRSWHLTSTASFVNGMGVLAFKIHLTVVFYENTFNPAAIFLDAGKSGSETQATLHDGAAMVSQLMQRGVPIEEIMHSFDRDDDRFVSPLAVGVAAAAKLIKEAPENYKWEKNNVFK